MANDTKCRRCGIEDANGTCPTCDRDLCAGCLQEEVCGQVLCVACGGPINQDCDTDFEDIGGGIHARCR